MSQYNKAKDRDDNGRITRFITNYENGLAWSVNGPSWFRRMTTTIPQRRSQRIELRKMMKGQIDFDEGVFLPNKRPIEWWW